MLIKNSQLTVAKIELWLTVMQVKEQITVMQVKDS